ncbi:hypothetical protein [Enterobacter sp. RD4-1-1]|uniref:hypothetical protein n=1 Tax=Enterobacter sp. RD4-1-1 TaxID=2986135 RepID=UPI0021E8A4FE|nr:hypothetical protein [Enterobacter sp. RD4-1-1]MCV3770291.1 hypothetical protein [Enterobacter sp. RD4-1-1]
MSSIKTITATMIRSILADDFNVGQLVADGERRKELAAIAPEEVDELVSRLQDVKSYVATAQEERRREALEALKSVIGDTGFTSVEELLAAAGGVTAPAPVKAKAKAASNSNNKSFTVVIGQKSYTVINKQIPAGLRDSEAYQTLIKARPEMEKVDNLLREYSTDYQQAYPMNAMWNGKEFHINSRGKLNETSQAFFEEFKKKDKSGADDKILLANFKKKVEEEFNKQ